MKDGHLLMKLLTKLLKRNPSFHVTINKVFEINISNLTI